MHHKLSDRYEKAAVLRDDAALRRESELPRP